MGRKLHYKRGSFYRTDDRTGFPQRAEVTRQEWNGLIVDEKVWEIRQPQDLVKGVKDSQWVPDARPLGPAQYVGPISVAITADAVIGQTVIPVQTVNGFSAGDIVGCMTGFDDGAVFWTVIAQQPMGDVLVLEDGLRHPMPSGNLITLYRHGPAPTPPLALMRVIDSGVGDLGRVIDPGTSVPTDYRIID